MKYQVIICTHINKANVHNHIIINSVSFIDGKKYHNGKTEIALIRDTSDTLCEEYGLSVLKEKPTRNSKINFANYQKGNVDKVNYYTIAKEDLDRAIGMATSYYDFEDLMKAMDYEVIHRANKLSIRRSPYKKNIRIERYFGEDYSIDRIKERIELENIPRVPFIEEYRYKNKSNNASYYKRRKPKGLYALYIHYCYLLKVFPKKYPYQRLSPAIRADVRKMEEISRETRLLVSNNLKTNEQFFLFKEEKKSKLDNLMDQRSKLWYQHKKAKGDEEKEKIKKQINELNKEINPLRKEVEMCNDILDRSKKIESNLQEMIEDEEKRREEKQNEHIR